MSIHEILEIKKEQIIALCDIESFAKNSKENQIILPLDQKHLDDVFQGGFYSRKKYVIFGSNKTGKTQLCHQLCIQAYKHFYERFGLNGAKFIYYFDTENTFRPERIEELLNHTQFKTDQVLMNILISKIMSNSAFLLALKDFEKNIIKTMGGLLIVDTINNHFGSDLSNKNLSFRTARDRFMNILEIIDSLTNRFNLITILTSQVVSNFSKKGILKEIPLGLQFLNHYFSEFIYLSKKNEEKNYIHLVDSLDHPERKIIYNITTKGIQDYKI